MASYNDEWGKKLSGEELWASRQEEILTEAAKLFAQHGYFRTDTKLLAENLGVAKGTLYRYFPSKRELFLAAADRVMRMLCQRIDVAVVGIVDPLDQIEAAIRGFLNFFAEQPGFVELLIQERAQFKDRTKPTFVEHREVNIERWRRLYASLIAAGRVRDVPVDRITDVIGNLLYGTIFTNYFSGAPKSVDVQAEDITDILFNSILTDEERNLRAQAERQRGRPLLPDFEQLINTNS
jgi:AcrR family transcriptional regulator